MKGIRLKYMDHTADVGFELTAPTRATVFEGAAYGLAQLALGGDEARPRDPVEAGAEEEVDVRTTGGGDDVLLAAWLRELVYLIATRHAVPGRARVDVLDSDRVRARVAFTSEPPPIREIKGVTWHGLQVERDDRGWYAKVVFDV